MSKLINWIIDKLVKSGIIERKMQISLSERGFFNFQSEIAKVRGYSGDFVQISDEEGIKIIIKIK